MHIVAPRIQKKIHIPFLHIAEVTADKLLADNVKTVALMGTRFTMEKDFYKGILINRGIKVIIPGAEGVVLGCTEIGLLIKQEDSALPVYDTALLHAEAAAEYAMGD